MGEDVRYCMIVTTLYIGNTYINNDNMDTLLLLISINITSYVNFLAENSANIFHSQPCC